MIWYTKYEKKGLTISWDDGTPSKEDKVYDLLFIKAHSPKLHTRNKILIYFIFIINRGMMESMMSEHCSNQLVFSHEHPRRACRPDKMTQKGLPKFEYERGDPKNRDARVFGPVSLGA